MEISDAIELLENYLRYKHPDYTLEDIEATNSSGYWRVKNGCPGGKDCRHAFRGALGSCDGSTDLTIYFSEHGKRDEKGRWIKPYRVWEILRKMG